MADREGATTAPPPTEPPSPLPPTHGVTADREGATDQRQSDILANIQQTILNGTRCFETDDVDDNGV